MCFYWGGLGLGWAEHLNLRKGKVRVESLGLFIVLCSGFLCQMYIWCWLFYMLILWVLINSQEILPFMGCCMFSPKSSSTNIVSFQEERKENHSFSCDFVSAKVLRAFLNTAVPPAWPSYQVHLLKRPTAKVMLKQNTWHIATLWLSSLMSPFWGRLTCTWLLTWKGPSRLHWSNENNLFRGHLAWP